MPAQPRKPPRLISARIYKGLFEDYEGTVKGSVAARPQSRVCTATRRESPLGALAPRASGYSNIDLVALPDRARHAARKKADLRRGNRVDPLAAPSRAASSS